MRVLFYLHCQENPSMLLHISEPRPAGLYDAVEPAAEVTDRELTLEYVRGILADKCAAGYGTQVKALIESFGVSALSEVPPLMYAGLVASASVLGGDVDAG